MTPNTSDSPDAIRNRNIAVVRPPMNWLNRKDGDTAYLPLDIIESPSSIHCPQATRRFREASVCRERLRQQFRVFDYCKRIGRILDHLAIIFRSKGLVRFGAEAALAHRGFPRHAG